MRAHYLNLDALKMIQHIYAIDWIEKKGIKYYVFAHFYDWHPDDNQC